MTRDEEFMEHALLLAKEAYQRDEIPVGAVIVKDNVIIAEGSNSNREKNDATMHAEIIAIKDASRHLNNERLVGCDLYVTKEPCAMCAGAIIMSRINKLFYGARDEITGSCGSVVNLFMENYGQSTQVTGGVLANDCAKLLSGFFRRIRSHAEQTGRGDGSSVH